MGIYWGRGRGTTGLEWIIARLWIEWYVGVVYLRGGWMGKGGCVALVIVIVIVARREPNKCWTRSRHEASVFRRRAIHRFNSRVLQHCTLTNGDPMVMLLVMIALPIMSHLPIGVRSKRNEA